MMLQQAGGNAWELCSKSGNDVATGGRYGNCVPNIILMLQQAGGNAWELCSKSGNDVATGRGKDGNSVPKMSMMLQHFNMLLRSNAARWLDF